MSTRREFLHTMALGTAAAALPGCVTTLSQSLVNKPGARPNILLIMADDMGYSDLGCYGGEIDTPNIDSLASGGLRFTQFYNAARCCPTRASLLTGLYPHQAGMGKMVSRPGFMNPPGPYQGYLNEQCVTLGEVLKGAGYNTLMSGKWHVGEFQPQWPTNRGFDRYYGLISGAANYFDITKAKSADRKRVFVIDGKQVTPPTEDFYMTDAITENAVAYLAEYGSQEQPFFLYTAYTAPHYPLHALPEDIAKYRDRYVDGWDELREERYHKMVELGLISDEWPLSSRDPEVPAWEEIDNKEEMALKMAVYAAQIDRMDQGIGKILAQLKVSGQEENTLVMFLSDNGGCAETAVLGGDWWNNDVPPGGVDSYKSYGASWANASNSPFRLYKQWAHEGGIATPLIARWPAAIKPDTITDQPGHLIDFMPTVCDIAQAEYPTTYNSVDIMPEEGLSLLPILKGKERAGHETICWEHYGNRAIRQGEWKLVSVEDGEWELYNLETDRTEINNLVQQHPQRVSQMDEQYRIWARRVGV